MAGGASPEGGGASGFYVGRAGRLLGEQLVGPGEGPGPGDVQDVGVGPDVVREPVERGGEPDDADGGLVEDLVAGGAVDLDAFHFAVRLDRDRQLQRAVKLLRLGFLGIVEVADALDL